MSQNCTTLWNNCLHVIKEQIPQQSFDTWFSPITPIKFEQNILTIQVPSQFFYEWLEEHYVHILKQAINTVLGSGGKLEYSVIVDKGNQKNSPFTVKFSNGKSGNGNGEVKDFKSPFQLNSIDSIYQDSQLCERYTFTTYIEGDCNRLARSAGYAVAKKPGVTSFNPLMVYGGVGLGKTHLAHAIGHEIKKNLPDKFVLYVSSEKFINQFINAVMNNEIQDFTNFYLPLLNF